MSGARGAMRPAFLLWGLAGFVAGVAAAVALAAAAPAGGRSAGVVLVAATAAALTFLAGALATKVVTGEERMAFYPFAVAVAGVTVAWLAATGRPVLAHLDLLAVGLAAFLALGRLGCLAAGCCHGRPADRGVRYGAAHVAEGFPAHLAGVTLVPVQALESLAALAVAVAGAVVVIAGRPAGTGAGLVAAAYAGARFGLELLRGDAAARPAALALSRAQWTSVALVSALAALGAAGMVPGAGWHLAAALVVLVAAAATAVAGRHRPLLAAGHVHELSHLLGSVSTRVETTARGLRLSGGPVEDDSGLHHHYAFSHAGGPLPPGTARRLAAVVVRLRHPGAAWDLVHGGRGVYHVVVHPPPGPAAVPGPAAAGAPAAAR